MQINPVYVALLGASPGQPSASSTPPDKLVKKPFCAFHLFCARCFNQMALLLFVQVYLMYPKVVRTMQCINLISIYISMCVSIRLYVNCRDACHGRWQLHLSSVHSCE